MTIRETASINQNYTNMLTCLNISINVSKFMVPGPHAHHSFLHGLTASGENASRYLFQCSKLCENNYNL